jgi:hypothetical protein
MPILTGASSRVKGLSSIEPVGPLTAPRLLFLVGLGVLTVILHETFHYPLKMPGHHGLEAMALLVIGRLSCTNPWSATIVSLSAAGTGLATGAGHDLSGILLNVAPGFALDLFVMGFKGWRSALLFLPVLVAFAHTAKPAARWLLSETAGMKFGSITKFGAFYPMSTHFAYGLAGAAIGVIMWKITADRLKRRE